MHISLIVHSQSGHTAAFARAIAERFRAGGHEADITPLMTSGLHKPGSRNFTISHTPEEEDLRLCDAVLFGGPVWGGKASPVIMEYLRWLKKLNGMKALCFVTQAFPWKSLGGLQAIRAMDEQLEASSCAMLPGEILHYFFGFNRKKLQEAVERIYMNVTRR
jgi:menaquinone-dependent protoporphyrinogen IX oxidase